MKSKAQIYALFSSRFLSFVGTLSLILSTDSYVIVYFVKIIVHCRNAEFYASW